MKLKFSAALQYLLLAVAILSLSACGYHLRGKVQLPPQMERTYVQGVNEYSDLGQALRRALEAADATLVSSPEQAGAIFAVSGTSADRRVLSVQASGKVQEYELVQSLTFSVRAPSGEVLIEPQSVEVAREYLYDRDNPLSSGGEESEIRAQMRRDLVQMVMRRLQIRRR